MSCSSNCNCPTCQPAQSIYQGECSDPGTLSPGRYLSVLDYKFCERRLSTGAGFLVSNINGSGNAGFTWTTTPQVCLSEYLATENTAFGNLVVMGSDCRWRSLQGPSTLGLFLQTDANGMLFFGDPPAAVIPDPLAVNDLSVANTATINDLVVNGDVTLNNLSTGTVVNLLGLDAGNEVVLQALTAGVAGCMFYESATSPGAGTPNLAKNSGDYLVIGNRLFDSGANLISVSTSESITVNVTGKYVLVWGAECRWATTGAMPSVQLEINGVVVSYGLSRPSDMNNGAVNSLVAFPGFEMRTLTAGDVLRLKFVTNNNDIRTAEARLIALKFAD